MATEPINSVAGPDTSMALSKGRRKVSRPSEDRMPSVTPKSCPFGSHRQILWERQGVMLLLWLLRWQVPKASESIRECRTGQEPLARRQHRNDRPSHNALRSSIVPTLAALPDCSKCRLITPAEDDLPLDESGHIRIKDPRIRSRLTRPRLITSIKSSMSFHTSTKRHGLG